MNQKRQFKFPPHHIMLDLETMATTPNAAIIAIGAVSFMPETMAIMDRFHEIVSLESCLKNGLEVNGDTVMWWMRQSMDAKDQYKRDGWSLKECLERFSRWMESYSDSWVWGNGASFDNVILANAYKKTGIPLPWEWWNDRCYRTVAALNHSVKMNRIGTLHNAIDDAESQAIHLMKIFKKNLEEGKELANAKFGKRDRKK